MINSKIATIIATAVTASLLVCTSANSGSLIDKKVDKTVKEKAVTDVAKHHVDKKEGSDVIVVGDEPIYILNQ